MHAAPLQSLAKIEQAAYVYGLSQAEIQYDNPQVVMGTLDRRLRLQACTGELEAFSHVTNKGLGNQTIGVRCYVPVAWTVYVPVKVKILKPVVIAVRSLVAKQIINKSDVRMERQDIASIRQGYVENIETVVGKQLKYSISMGMVISPNNLAAQKVVHRGEQIVLIAKAGSMEVIGSLSFNNSAKPLIAFRGVFNSCAI
jgi:flagella basal body P-ring formation protein FlgA